MSSIINVYQSLDQREKVSNYSSQPGLVYSKITTLSLLIRQVEKEGTGIIFCHHSVSALITGLFPANPGITVVSWHQLKQINVNDHTRILVVPLADVHTVRISELQQIAKSVQSSGSALKWISILTCPVFNQLFKWELRYN